MFRFFGRGRGTNNALTTTLKTAVNRLNTATKNATTALNVNAIIQKMYTKNSTGTSVTNIFKKAIASQFKIAHNAVLAAAAGRVPQTTAAQAVNYATANIKNIVAKLPANKYVNLNRNFNKNRANYGNVVANSNANKWWKNVNAKREARRAGTFPTAKPPGGALLGGAGMGPPFPPSNSNNMKISSTNGATTANITNNANGVWTINNSQLRQAWKLNNNRKPSKLVALAGNVAV